MAASASIGGRETEDGLHQRKEQDFLQTPDWMLQSASIHRPRVGQRVRTDWERNRHGGTEDVQRTNIRSLYKKNTVNYNSSNSGHRQEPQDPLIRIHPLIRTISGPTDDIRNSRIH